MKYFLAMCSTVKNEAIYLDEWIAYHTLRGFEHFYIHDDASSDDTMRILKKWESKGLVTIFDGFRKPTVAPQVPFYDFISKEKRNESEWCAFFDVDEFYCSDKNANDLLRGFEPEVSEMMVSWCFFGSNGLTEYDNRLVIERFLMRSLETFAMNRSRKVMARLSKCEKCVLDNLFEKSEGMSLDSSGNILHEPGKLPMRGEWGLCRLNHYAIKSVEEFGKKARNGRANRTGLGLLGYDFNSRDKNDVRDDSMLIWADAVKGLINKA